MPWASRPCPRGDISPRPLSQHPAPWLGQQAVAVTASFKDRQRRGLVSDKAGACAHKTCKPGGSPCSCPWWPSLCTRLTGSRWLSWLEALCRLT